MPFSERLKDLRLKVGLSVTELSNKTGISRSTLNDMENGRRVQGEPYNLLCNVLDCSLEYLLYGSKNNKDDLIRKIHQIEKILQEIKNNIIESG